MQRPIQEKGNSSKNRLYAMIQIPVILAVFLFASVSFSHDLVWPGEKLKTLFPQAESFEQKNLYVSEAQRASIERTLGSKLREEDLKPSVYLAVVRSSPSAPPRKAAAILFVDALGQGGKIEIGIVVNGKGNLMKVHIFENSEPAAISQAPFLRQFEGKSASSAFKVGSDITAPQNSVKSAQAVASGVKRGLLIINEVFKKK